MTYEQHLKAAIMALKRADPGISDRRISLAAGLHPGWVSDFMGTGAATMTRSSRVIRVIGDMCPAGPDGLEVRAILDMLRAPVSCPAPTPSEDAA